MATLARLLCFVGIILCCVFVQVSGDNIRIVLKALRSCSRVSPDLPIHISNAKITYSNRGKFFHINGTVVVKRRFSFRKGYSQIKIYRDGPSPMMVASFQYNNACEAILRGNQMIDPIFAPGAFPRRCRFEPQNLTGQVDYDLHMYTPGVAFRGDFMAIYNFYGGDGGLLLCMRHHYTVTKET